jgi:ABC-type glycerol-3-phosphate transport system substrate-binding protein
MEMTERIGRRDFLRIGAATAASMLAAACMATPGGAPAAQEAAAPQEPAGEIVNLGIRKLNGQNKIRFPSWSVRNHETYVPLIRDKYGVDCSVEPVAGNFPEKVMTEVAAGVGGDLLMLDAYWQGDFFQAGLIQDFEPFLTSLGLDRTRFADDPFEENGYEGMLMGLSQFPGMEHGIVVNGTLADKLGVGDGMPVWGAPDYDKWDLTQWIEWGKEATQRNADGTVEVYGLEPTFGWFGDPHTFAIYQNGGKLFDDPWSYKQTETLINSPECVQALQNHVDMVLTHKIAPSFDTFEGQPNAFMGGRIVATYSHLNPGVYREIRDQVELRFAQPPPTTQRAHITMGNTLTINKNSQFKDEVATWIAAFVTDEEACMMKLGVPDPATAWIISSWEPLTWVNKLPDGNIKNVCLASLSRIKDKSPIPELAEDVIVFPRHLGPVGAFFQDNGKTAMQSVLTGAQPSLQAAMDELKMKVDAELAKL